MPKLFISYRRKSWAFTGRLAEKLATKTNAEVFVDFTGIDDTDFEKSILKNLRESDAVLLIVSEHTFAERIHRDDDWVRREIREALNHDIPIIVVAVDGLFPPTVGLPEDIGDVVKSQGIRFYPEFFDEAVNNLVKFLTRISVFSELQADDIVSVSRSADIGNVQFSTKRFRMFFILCNSCSTELKFEIIRQNQFQDLFEFEFADWDMWYGHQVAEERLRALNTQSKLVFVNAFEAEMQTYNLEKGHGDGMTNIAITNRPFPQNYYTWNTKGKTGIVIGVNSLSKIFEDRNRVYIHSLIRVLQRAVLFSLSIPNLKSHPQTLGCLFDFTEKLENVQYSASSSFLCNDCKTTIVNQYGNDFFDSLINWLQLSQLK